MNRRMPRAGDDRAIREHIERCAGAMRDYLAASASGDWGRARQLNKDLARLGVNIYLSKRFPIHRSED